MTQQQILPLKIISQKTFDNFWVSESQKLIIQKLRNIAAGDHIFLWAETQNGVSHLVQACGDYWQHQGKHCLYLDLHDLHQYQEILPTALDGFNIIVFDHLEAILTHKEQQELLFHCYNRILQNNQSMIFTAHLPPENLAISLADLKSRLSACLVLHLNLMNDEDKIQVLKLYTKQSGLSLGTPAARYLLVHYSRNLDNLLKLIDQLDTASLREKKRLTIPFIKKQLKQTKIAEPR